MSVLADMKLLILFLSTLHLFSLCHGMAKVQGNCTANDGGLTWLASQLSANATISCLGSPLQEYNAGRYWGLQFAKNASIVVFPASTQDVSATVKATQMTPLGVDYAFVSGAHGQTNASSSYDFIIDLTFLNRTTLIKNFMFNDTSITAVAYQGGSTWLQVLNATGGSGYIPVGARVSSVGAGGFSTGGGIGFLAGAYGYAIDRLRAMEVVLPSGDIVYATKYNEHSDLFWALQGGGGQFGIVTTFYQEAALEPKKAIASVYFLENSSVIEADQKVVNFFDSHDDPFSLIYYVSGYFPANPTNAKASRSTYAFRTAILTVYLASPNGGQKSPKDTFANLLQGLKFTFNTTFAVPFSELTEAIDIFFPYGFRRGFYGPQTTNATTEYLADIRSQMTNYTTTLLSRGEFPASTLWALQYMSPGLNGHLPASDADTAWPHAIAGHQTLFSPAYESASDDGFTIAVNTALDQITYAHQASVGPFIADYPNYISPGATGERVWGANVPRLEAVKQKYDPDCSIHNGRVFASQGCMLKGLANVFASNGMGNSSMSWNHS